MSVLEELMSRLEKDPDYLDEMLKIAKRSYFDGQNRGAARWRNGHFECMHPQCTRRAIGSHTLQKGNSLSAIGEGPTPTSRVVVSPRFNPATGDIIGESLSVEHASVFPGFCEDHDRDLFLHLEQTIGTPDARALVLQCCRTLCREHRALLHAFETNKHIFEAMVSDQNDAVSRRIETLAGRPLSSILGHNSQGRFHQRPDELRINREFASAQAMFLNSFDALAATVAAFFSDPSSLPQMFIKSWALTTCLDFALSGTDDIGLPGVPVPVWYFVMPRSGVTHMAVFCHVDDEEILRNLLERKGVYDLKPADSGERLFRLFEQFMINRTNHWFMRPSAWHQLPDESKKRLVEVVNNYDRSIYGDGTPILPLPDILEVARNIYWRPRPF